MKAKMQRVMMKKVRLNEVQTKELDGVLTNNKESSLREGKIAQAILLLDQGVSIEFIEKITKLGRSQIFKHRASYLKSGLKAIEDKRKGNPKRILSNFQIKEVARVIREESPRSYGYDSDFWVTSILADLIKRTYGVIYKSKTSYHLLFKQAKFSYHLPGKIYKNRNQEVIDKWIEENKPIIEEAYNDPDTMILCGDEMILSAITTTQKIWLPLNEYPKIEVANNRKRRSIYGFLNIKNGYVHAYKTEKQNMFETTKVLKKLFSFYPNSKILLLWDNAGWHRGSAVMEFIKSVGRVEVLHFPPYAPEFNPQEHVWKLGRSMVSHNTYVGDVDKTTDAFIDFLNHTKCEYSLLGFSPRL